MVFESPWPWSLDGDEDFGLPPCVCFAFRIRYGALGGMKVVMEPSSCRPGLAVIKLPDHIGRTNPDGEAACGTGSSTSQQNSGSSSQLISGSVRHSLIPMWQATAYDDGRCPGAAAQTLTVVGLPSCMAKQGRLPSLYLFGGRRGRASVGCNPYCNAFTTSAESTVTAMCLVCQWA